MEFTHEQITEILTKIASEKDGFNKIMTVSFDAMMRAERSLHNEENKDMSNRFRPRRFFGSGAMLELKVPRSRSGTFYPMLLALLKDEHEESQKLAFKLYTI